MKHINKHLLIIIMSVGILFSSCKKDFLNINSNPNSPTDDNITAELIFTSAAEGVGAANVGARASGAGAKSSMQFAQNWVGYMASNGDFARDNTETSYDIDFNFGNTLFLTRYGVLFDLHQAEVKGLATGDTAIAAAAMILSAKMYQELVDLFGDLPYSQAFQTDKYTQPAYDKAEDIYKALQQKLDQAIVYMGKTAPKSFATADIINHGDLNKWIKFANTQKLRLLIRQSESTGFSPTEEIAKITKDGDINVLGAGESVSVNPGYANELNKQSPFYANYGLTATGTIANTSSNANDYIVSILNASGDARLQAFFTPVGSSFVGNVYGDVPGNLITASRTSYFGPGTRICSDPKQDQWIMPSYESLFFKAEAIARGWVPGDGKAALDAAITESFHWLLDGTLASADIDAAITDYIANSTIADYTIVEGSDPLEKARFVAFQKYVANTCIDPLESYSDIRRLDFLKTKTKGLKDFFNLPALNGKNYISINEGKKAETLPVRLLYPQSEYTTNSENVLKEGTIDAFTSKLFWQK